MDFGIDFEQAPLKRDSMSSSASTEGGGVMEGLGLLESFKQVLTLGISDIFDASLDEHRPQRRAGSRPISPAASRPVEQPKATASSSTDAAASLPGSGEKARANAPGAAKTRKQLGAVSLSKQQQGNAPDATAPASDAPSGSSNSASVAEVKSQGSNSRAEGAQNREAAASRPAPKAGLFDALVVGVSTFSQKATTLLNTLDANFDQMFNPHIDPSMHPNDHSPPPSAPPQRASSGSNAQQKAGSAKPKLVQSSSSKAAEAAGSSGASPSKQAASPGEQGPADAIVSPRSSARVGLTANSLVHRSSPRKPAAEAGPVAAAASSTARTSPRGKATASGCDAEETSIVDAMIDAVATSSAAGASSTGNTGPATILLSSAPQPPAAAASAAPASVAPTPAKPSTARVPPSTAKRVGRGKEGADELARLKAEYERVMKELEVATHQCEALSEENNKLRAAGLLDPDPTLSESVARQLQTLLAEKARLAEENCRLARENQGLQELLAYTKEHSDIMADEGAGDYESSVSVAMSEVHSSSCSVGRLGSRFDAAAASGMQADDDLLAVAELYTLDATAPPPELDLSMTPSSSQALQRRSAEGESEVWGSDGGAEDGQVDLHPQALDCASSQAASAADAEAPVVCGKAKKGAKAVAIPGAKKASAAAAAEAFVVASPPDVSGGYDAHAVLRTFAPESPTVSVEAESHACMDVVA